MSSVPPTVPSGERIDCTIVPKPIAIVGKLWPHSRCAIASVQVNEDKLGEPVAPSSVKAGSTCLAMNDQTADTGDGARHVKLNTLKFLSVTPSTWHSVTGGCGFTVMNREIRNRHLV